jgi:hypothetical protein
MDICKRQVPPSIAVSSGHIAACWLHVDPANRQASENGLPATASDRPAANHVEAAGGSLDRD